MGETDSFVAVSRTAVEAASAVCSNEQFAELESAIFNFTPDWERRRRMVGRTRLALLRALAQERIGQATRLQIRELERRFPDAPERGAPQSPVDDGTTKWAGPPISPEAQRRMADDHWLSAMSKYTSDEPTLRDGRFVGGAPELAWELSKLVSEGPARFAALADRMEATLPTTYFEAILRGLTRSERGPGRPGSLEQVCSVLRRIAVLGVPVPGREVALAIETVSDEALPDDIEQMLCSIALDDPDPEEDMWRESGDSRDLAHQAINSARGTAAHGFGSIALRSTKAGGTVSKRTVERLAVDNVLAVRSVAVECLLAILDVHRCDALACFDRLASGADPLLGTDTVERFVRHAMFRDYPAMRPTLLRMLTIISSLPQSEAGARQVTLAGLWLEEAREDAGSGASDMGEDAQDRELPSIYAFNTSRTRPSGAECERCLLNVVHGRL